MKGEEKTEVETAEDIINGRIEMKEYFSKDAVDLIKGLTHKDPNKRLGCEEIGVPKLKAHPFFKGIDWKKLLRKELPAPYQPSVRDSIDVSNIDFDFTSAPIEGTEEDTRITEVEQTF